MKYLFLIFILLIACSNNVIEQKVEQEIIQEPIHTETIAQITSDPITKTVKQVINNKEYQYGFSDDNRLLRINDIKFIYDSGRLVSFGNNKLGYEGDKLVSIGDFSLTYTANHLSSVSSSKNWYFDYVMGNLDKIRLGVSGGTSFNYNSDRIKSFNRGNLITNIKYDDKVRIRSFDSGDSELILGYWRDNKLISLTGSLAQKSLTISYGPDYPPFEAKFVSDSDNSIFTSAYTENLYSAVDFYLYCNYIYRPELLFDGISYSIFINYFNGSVEDYVLNTFLCGVYES